VAAGSPARAEPAEVRQERISALVEEQGCVRVSDLSARFGVSTVMAKTRDLSEVSLVVTDASADPSILADLAAAHCDVQVAEPTR